MSSALCTQVELTIRFVAKRPLYNTAKTSRLLLELGAIGYARFSTPPEALVQTVSPFWPMTTRGGGGAAAAVVTTLGELGGTPSCFPRAFIQIE